MESNPPACIVGYPHLAGRRQGLPNGNLSTTDRAYTGYSFTWGPRPLARYRVRVVPTLTRCAASAPAFLFTPVSYMHVSYTKIAQTHGSHNRASGCPTATRLRTASGAFSSVQRYKYGSRDCCVVALSVAPPPSRPGVTTAWGQHGNLVQGVRVRFGASVVLWSLWFAFCLATAAWLFNTPMFYQQRLPASRENAFAALADCRKLGKFFSHSHSNFCCLWTAMRLCGAAAVL